MSDPSVPTPPSDPYAAPAPAAVAPPLPPPPPPPGYVVPVAALAYADIVRTGRPPLLTAVGVVSIVIAALGFIGALFSGGSLAVFNAVAAFAPMTMAAPGPAPVPAMATTSPAGAESGSSVVVGERGLQADERAAVAQALGNRRFLSKARADQLDMLLAEAGQDIFPQGDTPLTRDRVAGLVRSQVTGLTTDPSVPGPDVVRTDNGRFELYDERAVFYPNGGGEIVRVSALTNSTAGLSPEQVEQILKQAQSQSGNTMNPSQLAGLRTLLSVPSQQHVSVVTVPTAIRAAQALGDGSVMVTFPNGFTTIGPQGQIQMSSYTGADGNTVTTSAAGTFTTPGPGAPAGFGPGGGGAVRPKGSAMSAVGLATLAGALLAAYLLVAGILVLRNSPRGRKLHLIYAWIKIPLALLTALAAWWLVNDYIAAVTAQANAAGNGAAWMTNTFASRFATQESVLAILGLVYPIALLIVMQTRSVKDYYNSVRVD